MDMLCFCERARSLHFPSFGHHCYRLLQIKYWAGSFHYGASFFRSSQPHLGAHGWWIVWGNTLQTASGAEVQSINVLCDLQVHRMHLVDEKTH